MTQRRPAFRFAVQSPLARHTGIVASIGERFWWTLGDEAQPDSIGIANAAIIGANDRHVSPPKESVGLRDYQWQDSTKLASPAASAVSRMGFPYANPRQTRCGRSVISCPI